METFDPRAIGSTCMVLHLRRAARRISRLYDDALRPVALNNGQFSLLTMLAARDTWTMLELAEALGLDQSSLTAAVKPLIRRGLIEAAAGTDDRRTRVLQLSPPGRALLAEAEPLWRCAQDRAESFLGERSADALRGDLRALA